MFTVGKLNIQYHGQHCLSVVCMGYVLLSKIEKRRLLKMGRSDINHINKQTNKQTDIIHEFGITELFKP